MSRFGRAPTWKLGLFRCKRDPNLKEPGRQNLSCFFSSIISTTHTSLNGSFHFSLYLFSSFSLLTSSLLLHLYSLSPTLIVISHLLTTQKLTNDFPHVGIFLEVSKWLPRSRQMISHMSANDYAQVGKWALAPQGKARQGKWTNVHQCGTSQSVLMCSAKLAWTRMSPGSSTSLARSIKSCSEYMSELSTKCWRSLSYTSPHTASYQHQYHITTHQCHHQFHITSSIINVRFIGV